MKPHRWHEVNQLSELLEAEIDGRPFDRDQAHRLACVLAEFHPEIRQSMDQICSRISESGCST